MIVYRVESTDHVDPRTGLGAGPFAGMWYCDPSDQVWLRIRGALMDSLKEPTCSHFTPGKDPILRGISRDEVCGMNSLDALRMWFGSSLQLLLDNNFHIVEYDVPCDSVRRGYDGQVVFEFAHAERVREGVTA